MAFGPHIETYKVRKGKPVVKVIALILAVAVIACGVLVAGDVFGFMCSNAQKEVVVPEGASTREIAQLLKDENVIRYPFVFRLFSKAYGFEGDYQQGEHTVVPGDGYKSAMRSLSQVAQPSGIKLTVPEGYELRQIAAAVENAGLATAEEFLNECDNGVFQYDFVQKIERSENRLEGYLFPATYTFEEGTSVHLMVDAMLAKFNEVYSKYQNLSGDMTVDQVVTLASLIEREAQEADFPLVSGVFHNRLKDGMLLQSCASVQYILQERKPVLSTADTKIVSPYNTYLNPGLPVGPIASPGEAAIKAAIEPADTDYYYFLTDGNGNTVFSKTFNEHQQAMEEVGL